MLGMLRSRLAAVRDYLKLTQQAKAERRLDRLGLPAHDPGASHAVDAALGWLCTAQDCSASHDGGVARHFSLLTGWGTSYPETTGYIVPTFIWCGQLLRRQELSDRARRMLDWLVTIQLPDGAFQGGTVGSSPVVPTVFDTGQILMGLAAGAAEFGEDRYFAAMTRAAGWLVGAQKDDGSWPQDVAPFAMPGAKAYDTHVAWGLLQAAEAAKSEEYRQAALANVRWAVGLQHDNGWFDRCCLSDHAQPLTHTIGYALRGIIEAYRATREEAFLRSAERCADGLLAVVREDGFLPGRLDCTWHGTVPWVCLTGSVQIAACWLLLHRETRRSEYLRAARACNAFVRRTVKVDGPPGTRGGVKGSFPVDGWYGKYQYLNWACKFLIDANLLDLDSPAGHGVSSPHGVKVNTSSVACGEADEDSGR